MAGIAENQKTFKRHHLEGKWPDLKKISQKFPLGDPLLKLLKLSCSGEQNGSQSLKDRIYDCNRQLF